MKFVCSPLAASLTLLSLLTVVQAVSSPTNGSSCGAAKADDGYFSVVGVQATGIHPRQELRELEKDTELWNIFVQAFARFQAMDQSEKISYYQVAGIHGVPFVQWDGVGGVKGQEMMGYCPHTSSMFGPWHRPYLALFEQILNDRAVDVAHEYPEGVSRERALELAHRVRLPYWDWAINPPDTAEGSIPRSLRRATATVTFQNGTVGEIPNPLYRYDFHPLKYDDFSPLSEFQFKNWNHTIRYPLDGYAINATSRNDEVNERVGKQQPNLRNMLYKLLTTYQPFMQVSNKANGGTIGNFETLHDGLHSVFGLGHMGIVEVSAFEPLFWVHHCNMDRIIAIYQSRYPNTWIEDSEQASGTFAVPKGSILGTSSPLAPFHRNAFGDMWTATTSRDWTSFGYTYPELLDNPSNETLTSSINRLYASETHGLNSTNTTAPISGGNMTTVPDKGIDWLCEVNMPTDIKISYSVRAFLGEPDADPTKWPTDANYIGQLASMSSPRMNSSVIVTGSIGLTEKLAEKHRTGELKSLDKATVAAYLKANFTWRIQALDFSEIPRNSPPAGLNVTVFNVPITIPTSLGQVPTWAGDIEYNEEIEGNPPVYDGPGPDGTNSTLPVGEVGGSYNATSGEYEWKDAPDSDAVEDERTRTRTSWVTQYVTVSPSTSEPPKPTAPVGLKTEYVTSVVMEYVTVYT